MLRQFITTKCSLLCLVVLLMTFSCLGLLRAHSIQQSFFFYHPDSKQSNLSYVKLQLDTIVALVDSELITQPFAHLVDFQRMMEVNKPAFVYLPQWYLKEYGKVFGLHPILSPVHNGSVTYRKLILTGINSKLSLKNLSGHSFAMTTMGPRSEKIIAKLLKAASGYFPDNLNLFMVPKDSDALFALALGHVELALVSQCTLDRIFKISPRIALSVRVLGKIPPLKQPVLCYVEGVALPRDIEKLKNTFQGTHEPGIKKLIKDLFETDEWQEIIR